MSGRVVPADKQFDEQKNRKGLQLWDYDRILQDPLCFLCLVNEVSSGIEPNVMFFSNGREVLAYAVRDIPPGQELLTHYGCGPSVPREHYPHDFVLAEPPPKYILSLSPGTGGQMRTPSGYQLLQH